MNIKRMGILFCILIINCKTDNDDLSITNVKKFREKEDITLCDKRAVIKPKKIDSRYVAFDKLNVMVKTFRNKLNAQTFGIKSEYPHIKFNFPIKEIFPLYANPDDIYEGLGYDPIAVKSLELIFHTLTLEPGLMNEHTKLAYHLLVHLSDIANKVKLVVNEKLNDASLAQLKSERTPEQLTKIYFYLGQAMINRQIAMFQVAKKIKEIVRYNFDGPFILASLKAEIFSSFDVMAPFFNMLELVNIIVCFIEN